MAAYPNTWHPTQAIRHLQPSQQLNQDSSALASEEPSQYVSAASAITANVSWLAYIIGMFFP